MPEVEKVARHFGIRILRYLSLVEPEAKEKITQMFNDLALDLQLFCANVKPSFIIFIGY